MKLESAEFPLAVGADAGLLGLALSFLGAANVVLPPDDCSRIRLKWACIDAEAPFRSNDRISLLQKQADLLESEMKELESLKELQESLLSKALNRKKKAGLRRIAEAEAQAERDEEERQEEEAAALVRAEIAAKRKAQREALKARKEKEAKEAVITEHHGTVSCFDEENEVTVTVVSESNSQTSLDHNVSSVEPTFVI